MQWILLSYQIDVTLFGTYIETNKPKGDYSRLVGNCTCSVVIVSILLCCQPEMNLVLPLHEYLPCTPKPVIWSHFGHGANSFYRNLRRTWSIDQFRQSRCSWPPLLGRSEETECIEKDTFLLIFRCMLAISWKHMFDQVECIQGGNLPLFTYVESRIGHRRKVQTPPTIMI